MADVDTSSYGLYAKEPGPFDALGKITAIQNQANQNRLFQQEYNSKLGLSQIYKQAIDPQTGQLDSQKLNQLMSNPATSANVSLGLPQAYQNSQEAQQRNIGIGQSQYELMKNHLTTLMGYLGPLATGNPSANDVASTLGHAISTGVASPQEAANVWSSIPRDQQGNVDQTQLKSWVQQNLLRVQSAQQQLEATNPAPTPLSTGGQTQLTRLPTVGQPSVAGTFANTLPPTTSTVGPGNVPQALGPVNSQLQLPGQDAPQPQASPLAGSMPGLSGNGGGQAPGTPAAPPGPVQTGLAPGVADAQQHQAVASADQGVALQRRADIIPQTKALLGNLEGAINQFNPGPGASWKQMAKSFANANSPFGNVFDPKTIATQEEFNKQAVQLAQQQFQALGGTGTDAKLDSASHTSPNDMLTPLGNKGIIQMLKGNEDAIAIKNREWQAYQQQPGNGPQDYGKFSTQFNREYDPRIFQSAYMDQADRKKMLSGMSKNEQGQFRQQYNMAVQRGWIPTPGQANASQ